MSTNNPSLVVQRLDRAAALSAPTTGLPRKCLVFGDDGAIQAIDATGTLRNIASSGGSIIPTDDNADDLGSAAKEWRIGFFGTKVVTPSVTAGGPAPFTDASLALVGVGTGVVNPQSPLVITPTVRSGNAATTGALEVIGAANTAVLASTEAPVVNIDLSNTVQFATGPKTTQRAMIVTAPTYTAVGATVIDDAATVSIEGAPIPSAPLTITRTHALWVQSGIARFDGSASVGGSPAASAILTVTSTTQGFLPPRMTEAARDLIAAPAAGLIVYNTSTNKLNVRGVATWEVITSV